MRGPPRGRVASQELALGVAISLADRERRHLEPDQQSAPELDVALRRRVLTRERRRRVVPEDPSHLGPERQEHDQPPPLGRGNRA